MLNPKSLPPSSYLLIYLTCRFSFAEMDILVVAPMGFAGR